MKKLLLPILLLFSTNTFCLEANPSGEVKESRHTPHHCPPDIDAEGAAVLTQFAGMVCSFVNIVQSPHDAGNVGYNLGNIVHGLGNIIAIAIKRGQPLEDYVNTEEFKNEIRKIIVKKTQII